MANEKPDQGDLIQSPKLTPTSGPTEGRRQVDSNALTMLLRRIEQAKRDGAVNIAVNIDLLLELLAGTRQAMDRVAFKSRLEI